MKGVLSYTDFRKYLLDYYKEMRKKNPGEFSYRSFAKKVRMANASFLHNIMHGRRKPDIPTTLNIAAAMGLNGQETSYLASLVEMNDAASAAVKKFYQKELAFIKARGSVLNKKGR